MDLERCFKIPNHSETRARLVEAIPTTGSYMFGTLEAPVEFPDSRPVVRDTGFQVGEFHSIKPTVVGRFNPRLPGREHRSESDLEAIIVGQHHPGFVEFDFSGHGEDIGVERAKQMAVMFLRQGYTGGLTFYHHSLSGDKLARSEMMFDPWEGAPAERNEAGPQPPRIKLQWTGRPDAGRMIRPLVVACDALYLREYTPGVAISSKEIPDTEYPIDTDLKAISIDEGAMLEGWWGAYCAAFNVEPTITDPRVAAGRHFDPRKHPEDDRRYRRYIRWMAQSKQAKWWTYSQGKN